MKLTALCVVSWLITLATAVAQQADTVQVRAVYQEKAPNGMTRFFYDDRYFLADKFCQFKAIERIAYYDIRQHTFVGAFTDFNNRGKTILRGNYQNGKKEGEFTAYHPNGQLKWKGLFAQDRPQGGWRFYYPDGKPLLELEYNEGNLFIWNFWDQRGKQRVVDGNGRYEFALEADGYNAFGYVRYVRRGRVVNGRPHGTWSITYQFDDGTREDGGYERFDNGRFVSGYELYEDDAYTDGPRYQLVPMDFFARAERMIGKQCTIDDHSGFTEYLVKHLEDWFEGELDEMPDPQRIEFTVVVNKNGQSGNIDMKNTFARKSYADLLLGALRWVEFWFPSYAGDQFVDDTLTITVEAFPDAIERKLRFFDLQIKREKGI